MDCFRDWSGLLPDILVDIALCLPLMEDFMAFQGVCTNWRAAGAIKSELFKGLSKFPLLMLSQKDDSDERDFFSISKNKIFWRMPVPLAKDQRCISAGFGWILAMSSSSIGEISLFNPFSSSSTKIELPTFTTFPDYETHECNPEYFFIQRGILSANPSLTSNFTVFVAVNCALGFWRNGDKSWTRMDLSYGVFGSLGYYKGKMYAVDDCCEIFTWDPEDPAKARLILQHWKHPSIRRGKGMPYLVESSDGELLVIMRNKVALNDLGATYFGVMKVDLVKMECKVINDLAKDAVFLGDNTTFSLDTADFPGVIKPNCIYFTDDCWIGADMGVYDVGDGSIERFNVKSFNQVCSPFWVFPSF